MALENSYCGKSCIHCPERQNGNCLGCKPDLDFDYQKSLSEASKLTPVLRDSFDEGFDDEYLKPLDLTGAKGRVSDQVKTPGQDNTSGQIKGGSVRYSEFCRIAMCCRNNDYEHCGMCTKSFACPDYGKKGTMNAIISAQMDAWGMIDHGLKNSVSYQWILFACFLSEIIRDLSVTLGLGLVTPLIVTIGVAIASAYAYNKLGNYSKIFTVVMFLTLASLALKLLVSYGGFGLFWSYPMYILQLVVAVSCYKMTFDAYAEMISPVDSVLEKKWLKMWPLTLILYIPCYSAAVILALAGKGNVLGPILEVAPAIILNIAIPILMVTTINVCKKN